MQQFQGNPSIGIAIENLSTGKIIYGDNTSRTFTPASTTKTLIATAALHLLGPDYRFITRLTTNGAISSDGILKGNLYVELSGDPSLTFNDLNTLFSVLTSRHIKRIEGKVIIVTTPFPVYHHAQGYFTDDLNICYAAPSDAININKNCFQFSLKPNKKIGEPGIISNKAGMDFIIIDNETLTTSDSQVCDLDLVSTQENHYTLSGCVGSNDRQINFDASVNNPRDELQQWMLAFFAKNNITVKSTISFGKLPENTLTLAGHRSEPLSELVGYMMKKSDNLYANVLFKLVGATYYHGDATWKNGSKALVEIFKSLNIDTQYLSVYDGAGLSLYNRFSPETLIDVLDYNYQNKNIGDYFYEGLSIAGKDGTFKHFSLGKHSSVYDFRAKSGSMTYVMTLGGYIKNTKGTPIAVAIMINGENNRGTYAELCHSILLNIAQSTV